MSNSDKLHDPPTDAVELLNRHEALLRDWAEYDDRRGDIARAALRVGGKTDDE